MCLDGAAAMIGYLSGLTARIKEVAPEFEPTTHCVIHNKMLASRKISPESHSVFDDTVKMISLIKAHALNTKLFKHYVRTWIQSTNAFSCRQSEVALPRKIIEHSV